MEGDIPGLEGEGTITYMQAETVTASKIERGINVTEKFHDERRGLFINKVNIPDLIKRLKERSTE